MTEKKTYGGWGVFSPNGNLYYQTVTSERIFTLGIFIESKESTSDIPEKEFKKYEDEGYKCKPILITIKED